MICINMTRINPFRTKADRANAVRTAPATCDSVVWGKNNFAQTGFNQTASTLIFAALLMICSLAVGCSNDQPKPVSSASPPPIPQPMPPTATDVTPVPTPLPQAATNPVRRKVVRKAPATVTYTDKTSGVSFQYPRKYSLKTGEAAKELVGSGTIPMDFVQSGGVALAAVALPESAYTNSDLASAFFNVSVNRNVTADQCGEFSIPQAPPTVPADPTTEPATGPTTQATAQLAKPPIAKLLIGDMELQSAEAAGETGGGSREETAKYYHVFQNGACYEFALKVATTGVKAEAKSEVKGEAESAPATEGSAKAGIKRVDRDEVFQRLEKILATVKVNPVKTPEVNAEVKANAQSTSPTEQSPAQ